MKLDGIISLYRSMKSEDIERYRFEYKVGKATFDVFFFIDSNPFFLLFGVKGGSFSFELEVKHGFEINHKLDKDTYKKLCKALGIVYDPDRPFSPWKFFSEFNENIPIKASKEQKAEPHQIAKYRKVSEEEDKIYFLRWRDNNKMNAHVRPLNLDKTRKLLGEKAYLRCKEKNISSCWIDKKELAAKVTFPD